MNPLTLVKRIQNINAKEAALGLSEDASWHAKYKDSAYVFVGGIPFDLTEGDLLAVFAQYGEIVDVNLVRDKGTGKSKGFAFIAYEDQRSTNLAVDNLNGAQILGRIIRVDHVTNYKKKEEEDEETLRKKREERGVCRAFQRGECTRGAGCKFSHDEQRAANTGWGHEEDRRSKWDHEKFDDSRKDKRFGQSSSAVDSGVEEKRRYSEKDSKVSKAKHSDMQNYDHKKIDTVDRHSRGDEKQSKRKEREMDNKEDYDEPKSRGDRDRMYEKVRRRDDDDRRDEKSRGDRDRMYEKVRRHDHDSKSREDDDRRGEKSRGEHDGMYEKVRRHGHDSKSREDDVRRDEKSRKHEDDRRSREDGDRRERSRRRE
ncbi:zinc finger CCCH domain-containing protein 25 [Ipomoea triloba]|uniref:zinc finger CCCH domain-containing protein 25 n=1 Tax=Ipomoea triloba TaxID=35885 RepID=UPI00125DF2D3|nr:zinc finger CCCH domain-containing protein 25 [Ipomoea triloba]XP_031114005.1 zinc finger CCCH domain-containing protein 25 [Ipomoea triloba]